MKRDFLKNLGVEGITDEVIEKIMTEYGKSMKNKEAYETEISTLKTQLGEANKAIENFKNLDIDGIKKAAEDWKIKAETAEQDSQTKLEKLQFDYALDTALLGAKTRDTTAAKAVKALLDRSILKLGKDGTVKGLQEQIDNIKKETPYLFQDEQSTPPQTKVDFGKPNSGEAPANADTNTLMNNLFRSKGD